jgi:hypothetical protein
MLVKIPNTWHGINKNWSSYSYVNPEDVSMLLHGTLGESPDNLTEILEIRMRNGQSLVTTLSAEEIACILNYHPTNNNKLN